MQQLLAYSNLDNSKTAHYTDKIWWRIIFACVDAAIIVLCIVMIEMNYFGDVVWQMLVIFLATCSGVDWVLRIFRNGKSGAKDEVKKASVLVGIVSSLLIIIGGLI